MTTVITSVPCNADSCLKQISCTLRKYCRPSRTCSQKVWLIRLGNKCSAIGIYCLTKVRTCLDKHIVCNLQRAWLKEASSFAGGDCCQGPTTALSSNSRQCRKRGGARSTPEPAALSQNLLHKHKKMQKKRDDI